MTLADKVIRFMNKYIKFADGTNFKTLPWQEEVIRELLHERDDGQRLIDTFLLSFGRKGGKSTFISALIVA